MDFFVILKVYPKIHVPDSGQSQTNGQTGPPHWAPSSLYDIQKQQRRRVMGSPHAPNFLPFQIPVHHTNVPSPNIVGENINGSFS
jgi:hypothetical protein